MYIRHGVHPRAMANAVVGGFFVRPKRIAVALADLAIEREVGGHEVISRARVDSPPATTDT